MHPWIRKLSIADPSFSEQSRMTEIEGKTAEWQSSRPPNLTISNKWVLTPVRNVPFGLQQLSLPQRSAVMLPAKPFIILVALLHMLQTAALTGQDLDVLPPIDDDSIRRVAYADADYASF